MLPGERVACPFEALGGVTVKGPFVLGSQDGNPSSSELLVGIRAKLGREAASMGADAALVRHLEYDRRQSSSAGHARVKAVEALLLRFVEPDCVQANR